MAAEKTTQAVPEEQISTADDTLNGNAGEITAETETTSETDNIEPGTDDNAGDISDDIVVAGNVTDDPRAVEELTEQAENAPSEEPATEENPVADEVPAPEEADAVDDVAEEKVEEISSEDAVTEETETEEPEAEIAEQSQPEEPAPEITSEEPASLTEATVESAPEEVGEDTTEQATEDVPSAGTTAETIEDTVEELPAPEVSEPEVAASEPEVTVSESAEAASEIPAPVPAEAEAPVETVDFSEEEAELDKLAAEKPEFELGEADESERQHETVIGGEMFDPAGMSKPQLLNVFAVMLQERPVQTIRREVEAIKVAFYKLLRAEQDELRRRFIDEGGEPEDFAPPVDNEEERLKDLFSEYRRRRDEFIAQLDRSKEENLQIKLKVIEDLKELVNSSETLGNTFSAFRELQQRWREAGPVPQANVKDLWETYNHHVENFYSYIKINKELRDLDLKKNYEAKMALCEEAEALLLEPSIINSFHRLQKLHEQWRETGPVGKEYKESLWERFREASSRINKQHQEYFDGQKEEQKRNLDLKTELCNKTEELANGVWITRKEWNKASDRLLEIQKVWKTIGFAPRKDNAKIYERFRNACDRFFEQKRTFYQQVKVEMDHNLQLKNEICEAAEAVKDSTDWKKTTDELIALQKKWKEVGPVARRHSDAVWKRFRAACDHFFGRKSEHFASKDAEQDNNLRLKRELLEEIAAADIQAGGFEMIKEFQRRWSEIGFVPIKQKEAIQKEYKAVMDNAFSILRGSGQTVRMDRFRDKVRNMKTSGDKRLRFERDRLYNKVKQLESEIALLENNIGFFSNSKNAESMIRDVKEKIERTREEMTAAIEKINLIDSQEE